jgi:hypothetical protein
MIQARIGIVVASLTFLTTLPGQGAESARTPAPASQTASAADTARFLAGMPPSPGSPLEPLTRAPGWQQHASSFNAAFASFEKRQSSKIRAWSKANLTTPKPVLYYMFSGPDFLYANAFFPQATTYVLSGLEPVGQIPDLLKLPSGSIPPALGNLRASLRDILAVSFFITRNMRSELGGGRLGGTLPILYVFLARSGKTIREVSLIHLNENGEVQTGDGSRARNVSRGAKIVFSGDEGREQTLYYFSTNLANDGFRKNGFAQFCERLGEGDSFVKSASYLLHSGGFTQVRNFLLERSAAIVQDDTGIPVAQFDPKKWDLRPFGNYVGPIAIFPGRYQPKLTELHRKGRASPIEFGVGYRWRPKESSLLVAVRNDATLRQ